LTRDGQRKTKKKKLISPGEETKAAQRATLDRTRQQPHTGERSREKKLRGPPTKKENEKEDALITSVDSIQIYKRASYYCHTAGFN
jgi:hypothetical protein